MTGKEIIEFLQKNKDILNKDVDLIIKDGIKEDLKANFFDEKATF
ncbi:MAG: hypothetical protein ACOC4G_13815 [Bacillota bacterium]